uniref:Uncharacterized protein n=1 Tax=Anguilla anguilla TaxID=7936 RepID=A0A0E9SVE4_ANGAN
MSTLHVVLSPSPPRPDNHFLYGNRALCFINSEK